MWVKHYRVTSSTSFSNPNTTQTSSDRRYRRLRIFNGSVGALHFVQAIAVLALANDFSLPVTATFMQDAPGASPPSLSELFQFRLAWGVAGFLLISAAAHWIIASPGVFRWYRHNLECNRNYARWVEY